MSEASTPQEARVVGGLTPYLNVDGALKAAEFYRKAFALHWSFPTRRMKKDAPCTSISTSTVPA